MTFVVIGGGPTGVELAGAIAELAHSTLEGEYDNISPAESDILLLEGQPNILPAYPPLSSANDRRSLERLGVRVQPGTMVEDIQEGRLVYRRSDGAEVEIHSHTILWAAGMQASSFTRTLQQRTGVSLDRSGRVIVEQDLSIPGWSNIFAIGDMTHFPGEDRAPLPGVAPVAMQQGRYIADVIKARLKGSGSAGFKYKDKGSLAVIGRNAAVAVFGRLQIAGFLAWVAWIFIHLWYIIEYDNKLMVLIQWAWNYFTRKRGARLITGSHPYPVVDKPQSQVDMVESSFQLDAIANHKSR
jgi:NADH dehydrogenase